MLILVNADKTFLINWPEVYITLPEICWIKR